MAFQVSVLPNMAAATTELWPTMSNAMAAPWRVIQKTGSTPQTKSQMERREFRHSPAVSVPTKSSKIELPECLQDLPPSFATSIVPRVPTFHSDIRHAIAVMSKGTLAAANPILRRAFIHTQSRQMSTGIQSRFQKPGFMIKAIAKQRRTLFGNGSTSRNILAHLEESANKNPNSATTQYAFYQALMKANMPAIVIDRYQSNRFASNNACENLYNRALGSITQSEGGLANSQTAGQGAGNLSQQQLQAIGQAVAATNRGGNVAVSRGQITNNSGAKDTPLHVVVDETIGHIIFKWFKLFLYFGLATYMSMVVVALIIESFQTVKKMPGKGDNEAKAEHQNVRFSDVHGCDEAKDELQELVEFLKNPDKFSTLGGKLPKGVLLVGPPGTGKTLLARAVAGEAGVPFFFMSGSEFDEIYVGVGAKRVRELFAAAKAKSPAIVFIDELDAIGGKRNARDAAYVKQTLNQLLTELDGFEQNSGVIILAATNFPELLDKALTRPGRFDRNVVVPLPDVRGRMAILKHHMKKVTADADVSIEALAQTTPGFSGADLENIINQAAVHASRAKAKAVKMLDFEWAKDKVIMGAERKSMFITAEEKAKTAYHEAGHALVIMFNPVAEPLHKITIMPRGIALGFTAHLPSMDKYSMGKNEYEAQIDVCMGGKAAEELVFGADKVTSGVAGDLQQATQLAYGMVTVYGMSDKLGNVDLRSNHDKLSMTTRELIETEVRRIIEDARVRATILLKARHKELELLAQALLDYETLTKDEAFKVIKGEKLEGRMIMPRGEIKVPDIPVGLPLVPEIPGSKPEDTDGGKTPPQGGAIA